MIWLECHTLQQAYDSILFDGNTILWDIKKSKQ